VGRAAAQCRMMSASHRACRSWALAVSACMHVVRRREHLYLRACTSCVAENICTCVHARRPSQRTSRWRGARGEGCLPCTCNQPRIGCHDNHDKVAAARTESDAISYSFTTGRGTLPASVPRHCFLRYCTVKSQISAGIYVIRYGCLTQVFEFGYVYAVAACLWRVAVWLHTRLINY